MGYSAHTYGFVITYVTMIVCESWHVDLQGDGGWDPFHKGFMSL